MARSLSNIFSNDEFIASGAAGVDDYEVDRQKIRSMRLTYIGRNSAGNRIWEDPEGHQYVAGQIAKRNGDGTPKLAGAGTEGAGDDDDDEMNYVAASNGSDYTTAWGDSDNYRYNNNPSEDILSKWQVTSSKRTVTNPRDLQSTRPLPDDSWDDIPETAGRGKYSKASVREAAERMPCVEAAKAEGREVRLQYNHSVNGNKKQTDQLLCPGSRREGRPVIVRFTGDLHSDGSQAAGRKAQLKASCEEEYRATTTISTGTGTDSATDCRPCCDDCDEDKEEKQAAKERLNEKYREQQTIRSRVVDKRSVTDKSQVTRGTQRPAVSPYYDPTSKNQLDRNPYIRYRHSPEYWVPQSNKSNSIRNVFYVNSYKVLSNGELESPVDQRIPLTDQEKAQLEKVLDDIDNAPANSPLGMMRDELNKLSGSVPPIPISVATERIYENGQQAGAVTFTKWGISGAEKIRVLIDLQSVNNGRSGTMVIKALRSSDPNLTGDINGYFMHEMGHVWSNIKNKPAVPLLRSTPEEKRSERHAQRWEAHYYREKYRITMKLSNTNKHMNTNWPIEIKKKFYENFD